MEKAQGTKPTLAQVHAPTRVVVAPLHRSADDALRRAGGGCRRRCRPAFPRAESEGTAAVGRAGPPQRPTTRPETGSALPFLTPRFFLPVLPDSEMANSISRPVPRILPRKSARRRGALPAPEDEERPGETNDDRPFPDRRWSHFLRFMAFLFFFVVVDLLYNCCNAPIFNRGQAGKGMESAPVSAPALAPQA